MKIKRIITAITAGFMCMSIAACSGNEASVQQSGTSSDTSSSNTSAATTDPKEESSVAKESSAAEENTTLSGKVTVYMPSPAGLADKLAAGFQEKTGVQVEVFQGTTGEILARLEAEEANPVA
ncbi:MAG: hypothetical protein ACI4KA_09240, partial [Oscillospiraceae bacterium]